MSLICAMTLLLLAGAPGEIVPVVVQAPDALVRLDRVKVLNAGNEGPPVLLYAATNLTDQELEQFTVILYVFDEKGTLKGRQTAPGRRTLEPRATKYSTMVLDGPAVGPTDLVVIGVNQAQRVNSEDWWRADLQTAAEQAAKPKPR